MTRNGFTPYLQSHFQSVLSVSVSKSHPPSSWEEPKDLNIAMGGFDDRRVTYGPFLDQDFATIRLAIKSEGATGLESYLKKNSPTVSSYVGGIILMSTSSRTRRFFPGTLAIEKKTGNFLLDCSIELELRQLHGEITLEPAIISKTELVDPSNSLQVTPGTVLGTSNLIRLAEKASENLLGDLFEYRWDNFSQSDNRYKSGDLFDLDLSESQPVVTLNEEISNFHSLMQTTDNPQGRQPKTVLARRSIDTSIAIQILEACGNFVISHISSEASIRREDDPNTDSFHDIIDSLSSTEQKLIEGFGALFSTSGVFTDGGDFCDEISKSSPDSLKDHLTSHMPRNIRHYLGAENAVKHVLSLVDLGDD